MSKISIQFHAEPTETIAFINDCIKELKLYVVLVTIQPAFTASLFDSSEEVLKNVPLYSTNRVCLYIDQMYTGEILEVKEESGRTAPNYLLT